jgi:hypothetical protein
MRKVAGGDQALPVERIVAGAEEGKRRGLIIPPD